MLRLAGPGLLGLILFCVWVYAIFDVITADPRLIRNLPSKLVWLAVVGFLNVIGAVAWFAFGQPRTESLVPGQPRGPRRLRQQPGSLGSSSGADGPRDWVDRVREARAAEAEAAAEAGDPAADPADPAAETEGSEATGEPDDRKPGRGEPDSC